MSLSIPPSAFWRFNNSLVDSYNGYTWTNNGSAGYTTGLIGGSSGAINLVKASNQSLRLADASWQHFTTKLSVSFWINFTTLASVADAFNKWDFSGGSNSMFRTSFSTTGQLMIDLASATNTAANTNTGTQHTGSASTATWYHYGFAYDGTQTGNSNRLKLYFNGSAIGSVDYTGTIPATLPGGTATLTLGELLTGARYANCAFDMLGVVNDTWSASDFSYLYNSGAGVELPAASNIEPVLSHVAGFQSAA